MQFRKDITTRRIYKFESDYFRGQPTLPMGELSELAKKVWRRESGSDKPPRKYGFPNVVAGPGTKYNGRYYSYFDGEKIQLARNERKKFVLIHEMVHALGYDEHDRKFMQKYFELLVAYKVCTRRELLRAGLKFKLVQAPRA